LLFFTDDDMRFDPRLLSVYAEAAAGASRGECYGGPMEVEYEGDPIPAWLRPYLPRSAVGYKLPLGQKTRLRKPWFLGCNWAAFACDIRAAGGFDPRFGPGSKTGSTGTEIQMQRELHRRGVVGYYLPEAMVWHLVAASCGTPEWILRRTYRHGVEWGIRRGSSGLRALTLARAWLASLPPRLHARWAAAKSDERARFHAEFLRAKWAGRFAGLRLACDPACVPTDDLK
jgi:hypothetical protein